MLLKTSFQPHQDCGCRLKFSAIKSALDKLKERPCEVLISVYNSPIRRHPV
jgi:hypothetical protein